MESFLCVSLIFIAIHYDGEFAIDAFAVSVLLNVYISIHSFIHSLIDGIISFSLFHECITFKSSLSGHNLHFSLSTSSSDMAHTENLKLNFGENSK